MDSKRCKLSPWSAPRYLRLLLVCAVSILFVFILSGAAVARFVILIEDGDKQTVVYTSSDDPEEILAKEYISLGEDDVFEFTGVEDRQGTITIHRAHRVTVRTMDGVFRIMRTGGTAADALEALEIPVDEDDLVNVALSETIRTDMEINITRVEYRTVERESEIPFFIEEHPTATLKDGRRRTYVAGENGALLTTVEQKLVDGEIVEETVLSEEVLQAPIAEKVLVGDSDYIASQLTPAAGIALDANGNPINYVKKVTGKATAYSSLGRRTSLQPGAVAMDLTQFPRGTKLYIKTPDGAFVYGYAEVQDTGTAVTNGTCLVDLFFDSYRESCLFGAKTVDIYVLS